MTPESSVTRIRGGEIMVGDCGAHVPRVDCLSSFQIGQPVEPLMHAFYRNANLEGAEGPSDLDGLLYDPERVNVVLLNTDNQSVAGWVTGVFIGDVLVVEIFALRVNIIDQAGMRVLWDRIKSESLSVKPGATTVRVSGKTDNTGDMGILHSIPWGSDSTTRVDKIKKIIVFEEPLRTHK